MKNRVKEISDQGAQELIEASEDVAYLTTQGYNPTEAIAKVASAAQFPKAKTNLLIYAYTNGLAAEKRGSVGGPFERLAGFPMPDPKEIERLVYGKDQPKEAAIPDLIPDYNNLPQQKSASIEEPFLPYGMETFEQDISNLQPNTIRALFGLETKTASDESQDDAPRVVINHTTITVQRGKQEGDDDEKKDARFINDLKDFESDGGFKPFSPLISSGIIGKIMEEMGIKKEAMIAANAVADCEYARVQDMLNEFGKLASARYARTDYAEKAAGLASVYATYPTIAELIRNYVDENVARETKSAGLSPTAVTTRHPWVKKAAAIQNQLEKVAKLTLVAQQKAAEYKAICNVYLERTKPQSLPKLSQHELRKNADVNLHIPSLDRIREGFGTSPDGIPGDIATYKDALSAEKLRTIRRKSDLSDMMTHDEIISSYPKQEVLGAYNSLVGIAPTAMQNKAVARSMLQQYLTQGQFAPAELTPLSTMQRYAVDARENPTAVMEYSQSRGPQRQQIDIL
jgi:hypothetical protein